MSMSARIRSGFTSRARSSASVPFATVVREKSSFLKTIPTAVRIVVESSARRRDFGMPGAPPGTAAFTCTRPLRTRQAFEKEPQTRTVERARAMRWGASEPAPHQKPFSVIEVFAAAIIRPAPHPARRAAAAAAAAASSLLLLHLLGDHRLGGEEKSGYARRVLQRGAGDLRRVDHPRRHQLFILSRASVVAEPALPLLHLLQHDASFEARVPHDAAERLLDRAADDLHADALVALELEAFERLLAADERDAAARDDALFHRGAGGVQRILHACLLLLHLRFGGGADLHHRDAAHELGEPLLELLAVVVGGRLLDLRADLLDPGLDVLLLARP